MIYDYEVMTEEEALRERYKLMADGIYSAVVENVADKQSSSGNAMVQLTLRVFDNNGGSRLIFDFLLFTKNMTWKLIHFCRSAGLEKEFLEKKFDTDMALGKNVKVKVHTKQGNEIPEDKLQGKPPGSRYPDKNAIEDYVVAEDVKEESFNDDLPF